MENILSADAAEKLYEVTNLNKSGLGSFADAVLAEGPRTVVFRISGTIEMGNLSISNPNITIAGQTAPGERYHTFWKTEHCSK